MRASLAASLALILVAAAPAPAAAQWNDAPREVWSASTGISALPSGGLAGSVAYGRNLGITRLVLTADGILVGDDGPYNLEREDGQAVCRNEETEQLVDASACIEGLNAAVRSEVLLRLGGGFALGPALRFDGDFTPYAALQLERSLRRSQPFNWFGHIGAGYEFLQIDVGVSIAH